MDHFVIALMLSLHFPTLGLPRILPPAVPVEMAAAAPLVDKWIAPDKGRHFIASAMITGMVCYMAKYKGDCPGHSARNLGMTLAFSLGISKEIADSRRRQGLFSFKDLVADLAGVLAGGLLLSW